MLIRVFLNSIYIFKVKDNDWGGLVPLLEVGIDVRKAI